MARSWSREQWGRSCCGQMRSRKDALRSRESGRESFRFAPDDILVVCISAAPAALDRYPRGVTGHVAQPIRSIETRSLPALARCVPRSFTFYVADPSAPFADVSMIARLMGLFPHDIFIVSSVDQSVDFSGVPITKENSAFDPSAEEDL